MKKNIKMRKVLGFSMVEVMVAAGMLGIIALGGMKMLDFQTGKTRDTSKNFQVDNIMYDLMFVLRDRDSCLETFKTKHAQGDTIDAIKKVDQAGASVNYLEKGKEYGALENEAGIGKVTLKEMKLGEIKDINANYKTTNLILTFVKKGYGSNSGNLETARILPLKFIVDGANLKRCVSDNSNNLEDLCSALGGQVDLADNDLCKSIEVNTFTAKNATDMGLPATMKRDYSIKAEGAVEVHGKMTFDYSPKAPGDLPVVIDNGEINNVTKLFVRGSAAANEVSATKYNHVSDEKEKTNIQVIKEGDASKILKLKGVKFNWKDNGEKSIGLVAQDVQKYYPELVSKTPNGLAVSYANLIAPMLEVIKRQEKEIRENEKQLIKIERKLSSTQKEKSDSK